MKTIIFFIILLSSNMLYSQSVWVQNYSGHPFGLEYANDIVIDAQGNIYITGSSNGGATARDPFTLKLNSAGVVQWTQRMLALGSNDEEAYEIALDDSNNVYVCGNEYEAGFSKNGKLLKYSTTGTQIFDIPYTRFSGSYDYFTDIVLDDSANIYVTGYSENDIIIAKFSRGGILRWAQFFSSPGAYTDIGNDIALDEHGNIYVCGAAKLSPGNDGLDAFLLKTDNAGNLIWSKSHAGAANKSDMFYSLSVDNAGNVCAGGEIWDDSLHYTDYILVKYDPSGALQWLRKVDGTNGYSKEVIYDVVTDNSGNVYAAGEYSEAGQQTNLLTVKYNATGDLAWRKTHHIGIWESGNEMALDNSGNVYVCGDYYAPGEIGTNGLLVKYNNSGDYQWAQTYGRYTNKSDNFYGIAIDPSGFPVVTGRSDDSTFYTDMLIIKYSQTVGVTQIGTEIPNDFSLSQNYPNPFNPMTKIKFDVPKAFNTKLAVYDILGKEVAVLVNDNLKPGSYEVDFSAADLPSGTYFYRLVADGFSETKKMTLIK